MPLDRANDYDAESLQRLLPDSAFQKATGVLQMISRSPDLRMLYDDRAKAELDQFSALKDARTEGEAIGKMIGRIGLLEQLLGDAPTDAEILSALELPDVERMAHDFEQRFSDRG